MRPYLMDLGSTNGTFLNDERLEPQRYYELLEKVRFCCYLVCLLAWHRHGVHCGRCRIWSNLETAAASTYSFTRKAHEAACRYRAGLRPIMGACEQEAGGSALIACKSEVGRQC